MVKNSTKKSDVSETDEFISFHYNLLSERNGHHGSEDNELLNTSVNRKFDICSDIYNKITVISENDNNCFNFKELDTDALRVFNFHDNMIILEEKRRELLKIVRELESSKLSHAFHAVKEIDKAVSLEPVPGDKYSEMEKGEYVHDFISRTNPCLRLYRGKKQDGCIIEFLRQTYKREGYLDGVYFTRKTLRLLDPKADKAVNNYMSNGGVLPEDIPLPRSRKLPREIVKDFTSDQIRAAKTLYDQGYR